MMSATIAVMNASADFWFYDIGVNVIPANTKDKNTFESWTEWQTKSIPNEIHEKRKKRGYYYNIKNSNYNNGIAIIPGPIWRGPYKGKCLVAIDLDNKKAIEEFCKNGLEELKQQTLIEQHADPNKMHIYFIVEREIPNKASDKTNTEVLNKINANEIPALEVKSNGKGLMFVADSAHKDGSNYQIKGTRKPKVFNAQDVENRIKWICDKYSITYGINNNNNGSNSSYHTPIEDLWKPETKILEGHNRHLELLRIMESLLQNNKKMFLEDIKQMAQIWNQNHCEPPLSDEEFEKEWKCALKFVRKNVVINNNSSSSRGDSGYSGDDDNNNNGAISSHEISRSIADILVKLTLENSTLFVNEFSIPHALLKINNDHYEVLSINGSKFEHYLAKLYYDNHNKRTANAEAIKNASRILAAKAIFEGQTIPLHLRVAWSNPETKDSIYYDLTDKRRRCIKITKGNGWKIADNQIEVLFKRYGQAAQIEPLHEYDNKILDKFVDSLNM